MSTMASVVTDVVLPSVRGDVDDGGSPFGKKMTREQLKGTRKALEEFRRSGGEKTHALVVAGGLGFRDSDLKKSTEEDVRRCCYDHFGYPSESPQDTVHVILDSGGGSLDSAFRIVLFLRRFAKNIRVYVPRRAKSAATLIALGADEIVMSPFAELGPLDTQITDPRNPTKSVSALDCYRSVDYVQKFGLETLPKALEVLLKETDGRTPLADLVNPATQFALDEIVPMMGQVKALDFGAWGRTLQIGETYARALQLRLDPEDNEKKADAIATKLVYGYPHHPYPIDAVEAKSLGLNVTVMRKREYDTALDVAQAYGGSRCVGFVKNLTDMETALSAIPSQADETPAHWVPAPAPKQPSGDHNGQRAQSAV